MDELKDRVKSVIKKLDLDEKRKRIREIEAQSSHSNFWQDHKSAAEKMKTLAQLQKEVEEGERLQQLIDEGKTDEAEKLIGELEFYLYLSGPYDKQNAIVSIHAGQGGVDAMDFAEMLLRMYTRYFEKKDWRYEIIDETRGEEAGIKSISILVEGGFAYGFLKGEQGVHRLVRLSPFNAARLRQTSFALIEVLPQVEEIEGIQVKENDLEWEFYRASSHGGQNVQKVSTAVRVKHIPTGLSASSQTQRYQAQNRESALKLLKAKLWAYFEEKKRLEKQEMRGEYKAASWGNQIRSYVLHPYQLVKDLRTQVETSNTEKVLNGDIDMFIEAQLKVL